MYDCVDERHENIDYSATHTFEGPNREVSEPLLFLCLTEISLKSSTIEEKTSETSRKQIQAGLGLAKFNLEVMNFSIKFVHS